MELLKDFTRKFFDTEKSDLEKSYPGINPEILFRELEAFVSKEQLHNLYVPNSSNPITKFFDKLKLGLPIPYITGKCFFYNSEFWVTPEVLIPRPETELLIEIATDLINKDFNEDKILSIIDIGTGSGNIIITLMQTLGRTTHCYGLDISSEALEVSRKNFYHLRYTIPKSSTLEFLESDRLLNFRKQVDVVISNPPYIMRDKDLEGVHSKVHEFEPHLALYLNDHEYFSWFEKLFIQVIKCLNVDGVFIMEGHENHLLDLKLLAEKIGFSNVEVKKDLNHRDRFLMARKKSHS